MKEINKKQSLFVSFLAGAVIAGASVYLAKKENREKINSQVDKMKSDVLMKSQNVTQRIKEGAQQLHTSTVEKANRANKKIKSKAEQIQKTAVDLHHSLEENTENKEIKEF